jgi:hypothetical protein
MHCFLSKKLTFSGWISEKKNVLCNSAVMYLGFLSKFPNYTTYFQTSSIIHILPDTRTGEFLNLPNPSGCTRPWGLLSL